VEKERAGELKNIKTGMRRVIIRGRIQGHTHTHTHTQKGKRAYGKAALATASQKIVAARFGFGNECAVDITAAP